MNEPVKYFRTLTAHELQQPGDARLIDTDTDRVVYLRPVVAPPANIVGDENVPQLKAFEQPRQKLRVDGDCGRPVDPSDGQRSKETAGSGPFGTSEPSDSPLAVHDCPHCGSPVANKGETCADCLLTQHHDVAANDAAQEAARDEGRGQGARSEDEPL